MSHWALCTHPSTVPPSPVLTVDGNFDFPHVRDGHVVDGAALVLPGLLPCDACDLQVLVLTHKGLPWGMY